MINDRMKELAGINEETLTEGSRFVANDKNGYITSVEVSFHSPRNTQDVSARMKSLIKNNLVGSTIRYLEADYTSIAIEEFKNLVPLKGGDMSMDVWVTAKVKDYYDGKMVKTRVKIGCYFNAKYSDLTFNLLKV